MPRLLTLCLAILVASPALASADECMLSSVGRGEVSGISLDDPLVEVFGNESVDVELEIRLGLRQLPPRGDTLDADSEGLLWCLSPDDSRCFPVDGPTEAPALADPMPASTAQDTPEVAERSVTDHEQTSTNESGPAGIVPRVDRPPRS